MLCKIHQKHKLFFTFTFLYKDMIFVSVLVRKYTCQKNSCSGRFYVVIPQIISEALTLEDASNVNLVMESSSLHELPDFHNRSFKKHLSRIFRKLWSVVHGTVEGIHICIPLLTLVLKNKSFRIKQSIFYGNSFERNVLQLSTVTSTSASTTANVCTTLTMMSVISLWCLDC